MPEIFIGEHNYKEYSVDNEYVEVNGERHYLSAKCGKVKPGFASLPHNFELIPKNEVESRAKDLVEAKATLEHVVRRARGGKAIPGKDQNGTNFCWTNSPAGAVEWLRELQGEPYVELSPASVANPLTGGRNDGGYIEDALEQITKVGIASAALYPVNAVGLKYWTPEAKANAALHKVTNWVSLGRKDSTMAAKCWTCLLQGMPVCFAYDWMGHAMTMGAILPGMVWRVKNSWGDSWGDMGWGNFEFGRGTPDAAYVPEWCFASLK